MFHNLLISNVNVQKQIILLWTGKFPLLIERVVSILEDNFHI